MSDTPTMGPRAQRVHIRKLPPGVTVEQLEELCRSLGIEGVVHFVRDAGSGRFAGEAYVAAPTEAAADDAAKKLNGHPIGEGRIEAVRVEGDDFFDEDGLFADGEAPMGRQDGRRPRRTSGRGDGDDAE